MNYELLSQKIALLSQKLQKKESKYLILKVETVSSSRYLLL